jgi:hypothetical protein
MASPFFINLEAGNEANMEKTDDSHVTLAS